MSNATINWATLAFQAPQDAILLHPTKNTPIIDLAAFLGKSSMELSETSVVEFILKFREYAALVAEALNSSTDSVDSTEQQEIAAFPRLQFGSVDNEDYVQVTATIRALIPVNPTKASEIKPFVISTQR